MNIRNVAIAATLAACGLLGLMSPAIAGSLTAKEFVKKASISSEFEIESSKIALEKSQNKEIKEFAMSMIADHQKAGENLNATLKSSSSGAEAETKLDDKHEALIKKLQAASKDDFNKKYVSIQLEAHKKAVALFKDYAANGDDAALKDFAAQTLPTLQEHLDHITRIKSRQ